MIDLDCSGIHVEGAIQPVFNRATIGLNAFYHDRYGCLLANFLVGDPRDPGFFIGREDSHPLALIGPQIKIPINYKIGSNDEVIPMVLEMTQSVRFFFRPYKGPGELTELVIGVLLRGYGYVEAGIWANHDFCPFGRQSAHKVSRLFNFFGLIEWQIMQDLVSSSYSIGAH